jgi:hypothetical protein
LENRRLLLALALSSLVALGAVPSAAAAGYYRVDYWYGPGYAFPYGPPVYGPPVYAPPVYAAPPVYVAPPPVYVAPRGPAPAQSWYYCDDPQGYYPNVPSCNGPWRQVPATPSR